MVTCPLVPGVPHLISGSCSSPRAFGLGFLQTQPHDYALALLLTFCPTNTWCGDLHPTSSVPCPARTRNSQAARAEGPCCPCEVPGYLSNIPTINTKKTMTNSIATNNPIDFPYLRNQFCITASRSLTFFELSNFKAIITKVRYINEKQPIKNISGLIKQPSELHPERVSRLVFKTNLIKRYHGKTANIIIKSGEI